MSSREAKPEGKAPGGCRQFKAPRGRDPPARSTKDPERGVTPGTRAPRNGRAKPRTARRERAVASDDCVSKLATPSVRSDTRSSSSSRSHARSSAARPKSPASSPLPRQTRSRWTLTARAPDDDDDASYLSVGADVVVGVASGAVEPVVVDGDVPSVVSLKAAEWLVSDASSAVAALSVDAPSSSPSPKPLSTIKEVDRSKSLLSTASDRSMGNLLSVLRKERPPTRLFDCSTAAVNEGRGNSDFLDSQDLFDSHVLEDIRVEKESTGVWEDGKVTCNNKSERSAAARKGQAVPRRKPAPT